MAIIAKLPGQAIIDGFKGTLDYYVYMGLNCVRSWPRSPGHERSPAVQAQWPAFTWAATNWKNLSSEVKEAYNLMASGTPLTGKDIFVKSYLTNTFIKTGP